MIRAEPFAVTCRHGHTWNARAALEEVRDAAAAFYTGTDGAVPAEVVSATLFCPTCRVRTEYSGPLPAPEAAQRRTIPVSDLRAPVLGRTVRRIVTDETGEVLDAAGSTLYVRTDDSSTTLERWLANECEYVGDDHEPDPPAGR